MTTRCRCSALWSCAISSGSAGSGVYTRPANIGNSRISPWMCVWQSHAPAGTSKFTALAGCDALASARRGATEAAAAASNIWRRVGMPLSSELVAPQAAVDRDHRAGNVARERRGEEAGEVREVLRLAVLAHRDVVLALALSELGRIVAQDLLADDAAGRNAVDGDAVLSDLA